MDMCKYKLSLKEFDYPNINGINDEQIADIFSSENRFFLLTWLAKNLNSQFILPLEWSKTTEATFANFFHESGFCTSSQKLYFVKGDNSLASEEQIKIFDRIFNYLRVTSQKENIQPVQNSNDIVDLELFLKKDINLFPTLGPMKLRTQVQRQQKIKYYKAEIEKLRQEIGNYIVNNKEDDLNFVNSEYDEEEVDKNVEKFKAQATKLQEIASIVGKVNKNNDATERVGFKPDFENNLINCNSELTTVLQYFQNVNLTRSVNAKEIPDEKSFEQNELSNIIKHHVESSADIAKMMKSKNN